MSRVRCKTCGEWVPDDEFDEHLQLHVDQPVAETVQTNPPIDEKKLADLELYLQELERRKGLDLNQVLGLFLGATILALIAFVISSPFGNLGLVLAAVFTSLIMTVIYVEMSSMARTRKPEPANMQ